jgi:hypothetical protein
VLVNRRVEMLALVGAWEAVRTRVHVHRVFYVFVFVVVVVIVVIVDVRVGVHVCRVRVQGGEGRRVVVRIKWHVILGLGVIDDALLLCMLPVVSFVVVVVVTV